MNNARKTEIEKKIADLQGALQGTAHSEIIGSFYINGVVLDDLGLSRIQAAKKRLIHEFNDIVAEEIYRLQVLRETGEDRIPARSPEGFLTPGYLVNDNFKVSQR